MSERTRSSVILWEKQLTEAVQLWLTHHPEVLSLGSGKYEGDVVFEARVQDGKARFMAEVVVTHFEEAEKS